MPRPLRARARAPRARARAFVPDVGPCFWRWAYALQKHGCKQKHCDICHMELLLLIQHGI